MSTIFTIGASTLSVDRLVELLREARITAIADVRSAPASRFTPQFNRGALAKRLTAAGIAYVFLGAELGARSPRPECYVDGVVQYDRLAQTPEFAVGLQRVLDGATRERIALLCTEQDPLDCHRTILVAPALVDRGAEVIHLLSDGRTETHDDAMLRLRRKFTLDQPELWTDEDPVATALRLQAAQIAYVRPPEEAFS